MTSLNGIVYYSPDRELLHLLLEDVKVQVLICDGKASVTLHIPAKPTYLSFTVSARVVLTQTYTNTSETPTSRAKYVFPVPSRAAVCAFELKHPDGRIIVGEAKEKGKAVEMHETAIREGKFTGLFEWVTDDGQCSLLGHYRTQVLRSIPVFTISIGSIAARQSVTTRLVVCVTNGHGDIIR
jgi:hypothetical protein